MEYKALFEIDCGISPGFGKAKRPLRTPRDDVFTSASALDAYHHAMEKAVDYAFAHPSNPETDITRVRLVSLRCPQGEISIDQLEADYNFNDGVTPKIQLPTLVIRTISSSFYSRY